MTIIVDIVDIEDTFRKAHNSLIDNVYGGSNGAFNLYYDYKRNVDSDITLSQFLINGWKKHYGVTDIKCDSVQDAWSHLVFETDEDFTLFMLKWS